MASAAVAAPVRARARLGKKEKQQLRQDVQPTELQPATLPTSADANSSALLDHFLLAQPQSSSCPVVFTKDNIYALLTSGSSVLIYSVATAQLVSTLSPLAFDSPTSPAPAISTSRKVSSLLINPHNHLQLIVAHLDGTIRVWDYNEGKLLRTLDLAAPVLFASGHESLPDQLFVALAGPAKDDANTSAKDKKESTPTAGIYSISLRASTTAPSSSSALTSTARPPSRRMRLAHPRPIVALQLSPSGKHLISVTPTSLHILQTAHLQRGFAESLKSEERLTSLAFHPSEDYFATGDARGRIRFWYGALKGDEEDAEEKKEQTGGRPATAIFHWHAHAVSSLAFTPNGAYLLSGGEEAVMVLWQLHTGHQEFVPRLGAPILSLAITGEQRADGGEQVVAARLRDGTTVLIGVQKLKISRTIAGVKADPPASAPRPSVNNRTPLALLPTSSTSSSSTTLVLPSSHPSSLQFYQPSTDTQLLELEVSPSNRVSAAGSKALEPTRVQLVAFSQPEEKRISGGYWMATVDSWQNGGFKEQQRLKFWWKKSGEETSFSLTTRIDAPHSSPITSLSFSPSTSTSSPLLLTTSLDGLIKLWSLTSPSSSAQAQASWACRSSLSYRSFVPLSSSWSADGSMFAIAHSRSVTLWSTRDLSLIKAFACESVKPVTKVAFGGEEGETLLAGGEHGVMGWGLLDFEESFSLSFPVASLTSKPNSSTIIATEKPVFTPPSSSAASSLPSTSNEGASTSTAFIIHAPSSSTTAESKPSVSTRPLPFPVTQSLWLPTHPSTTSEELSLAALSPNGTVSLLGAAARVGSAILPTRLPTAVQRGKGMSRLFDDIFGAEEEATKVRTVKQESTVDGKGKRPELAASLLEETPAHVLPPVRMLWREVLSGFKVSPTFSAAAEKMVVGEGEGDVKMAEQEEASDVVFAPSQAGELSKVFGERLLLSSPKKSPTKQLSGTPKSGKMGKH